MIPKFWRHFDDFRAQRVALGDWPPWCYCPLAGSYAALSDALPGGMRPEAVQLVAHLGAVASWRPTKGIYRFDHDLAAALVSTPLERELPPGMLYRLPEWCVWVDPVAGLPGFFAYLEHDTNTKAAELRICVSDSERPILLGLIVYLDRGTLADGIQAALLEATAQAALQSGRSVPAPSTAAAGALAEAVAPMVSLLLYLCSDEPDLGGRTPPVHPSSRARATGAQGETTWAVGERIGAALRAAHEPQEAGEAAGSHAAPRAHVRRAHWHTYWIGPRSSQVSRLRWLHPILVGAGDTVPTIHK
jgi:hypothetical protein